MFLGSIVDVASIKWTSSEFIRAWEINCEEAARGNLDAEAEKTRL